MSDDYANNSASFCCGGPSEYDPPEPPKKQSAFVSIDKTIEELKAQCAGKDREIANYKAIAEIDTLNHKEFDDVRNKLQIARKALQSAAKTFRAYESIYRMRGVGSVIETEENKALAVQMEKALEQIGE